MTTSKPVLPRTAVVSHVVPPSPSGQSIMLYRLLGRLPPEAYCLICTEKNSNQSDAATSSLDGRLYQLEPPLGFSEAILSFTRRLRASNYRFLSRAINGLLRVRNLLDIPLLGRQIADIVRRENCQVILGCTGEPHALPAAFLASRWAGVPFIAYIFDYYAYQHFLGFHRFLSRLMEPTIMRKAASIIVPNEFMQQTYWNRYGRQCTIVRNPCVLPDLNELERDPFPFPPGQVSITYTGAVYTPHYDAFRRLLAALRRLNGRLVARLHLFTSSNTEELRAEGIEGEHLVLHPHIHVSEVPRILHSSNILFLPLAFDSPYPEIIRTSAPGKMGEYMASARPILVHAPPGCLVNWYVSRHDCGLVVDSRDAGQLSEAVHRLVTDGDLASRLGTNARLRAECDFNLDIVVTAFVDCLGQVLRASQDCAALNVS